MGPRSSQGPRSSHGRSSRGRSSQGPCPENRWSFARGCALLLLGIAAPAHAQEVLTIASGPDADPALTGAASALRTALPLRGIPLAAPGGVVGRAPAAFRSGLAARLDEGAEQVVEDVAFRRTAQVMSGSEPLVAEASRDLDALGTTPSAARRVVDLLLFQARAHLDSGSRPQAEAAIRRALTLVPDARPDANLHPPEVLAVFTQVESARRVEGARLAVEVDGASARCELRLNGQPLGPPPARVRLFPGGYTIRASCGGAPGRVHDVRLDRSDVTVRIAPPLDAALASGPGGEPRLSFPASPAPAAVRELAALLAARVERPVLVLYAVGDRLRLERLAPGRAEPVARAETSADGDPQARATELAERLEAPASAPRAADAPAGGGGDAGLAVAAYVVGGLGLAGAAATWVATVEYLQRAEWARAAQLGDPDFDLRQQRRDDVEPLTYALGGASSALLVAATLLGAPSEDEVPGYLWGVGGAGLLAAVGGVVALSQHFTCANEDCSRRFLLNPLGAVLVMHGATLMSVPFLAMLRGALGAPDVVPFAATLPGPDGPAGGWAGLHGSLDL